MLLQGFLVKRQKGVRMSHPNKLEIAGSCSLKHYDYCEPSLCYTEHQADRWYSDNETEVDIDKAKAQEIIDWLAAEYNLSMTTGVNNSPLKANNGDTRKQHDELVCCNCYENENVLEGWACPECGHKESFRIEAKTMVIAYDDGTYPDPKDGDTEWDDASYCECRECNHIGTVGEFHR